SGGKRHPIVGGIRCTKIKFDPKSSICDEMLLLRPLMMDDIPITVATPITTPRIVRNDLSLFLRSESSVRRRISLISQCHYGIEVLRFCRRRNLEEQAYAGRHCQSQCDRPPLAGT